MSGKRSALIVATSEYSDHRLTALEGPGHDADALQTVLANAEIGGFDVEVALNSEVDRLRRTLETFFTNRARDDLLLVHFSGHGLKDDDGQLYLAAADTEIDRLLSTGVDASWVNRLMNKCRSEKIALFLDCCFAGAFTTGMARRVGVDSAGVKEQFTGSGLFVIAASDAMQYSFEGGQQVGLPPEPSPFTKALVDGLRTGEADRNEDGVVSINELFDYLEDRIRQTSPSQTPTKSAFNQVGDWAIARSTRVPSVRLLPEDLQKQLKSEDALDRFGALIYLRDLIEGADLRVAEAAMQAVQALAHDDSRRVAAAAQRLAAKEAAAAAPDVTSISQDAAPRTHEPASIAIQPEPASPAPAPAATVDPQPTPTVVASAEPAVVAPVEQPRAPTGWGQSQRANASPLWGQASLQAQQAVAGTAQAGGGQTTGVPWSLGRAAGRAVIGTSAWIIYAFAWGVSENPWVLTDPDSLEKALAAFLGVTIVLVTFISVGVVIVEKLVPALRIPGGAVYRLVGGNRWLAAASLGTVTGLLLGAFADSYLYNVLGWSPGLEAQVLFAVLGFVSAEAVVGRRSRGSSEERTKAA